MFEDLLSSANDQQKEMDAKLATILIEKESSDNSLKVTINGKKEVLDISIKKEFEDITELEDLLVITLNSAIMEAEELAAKEANNLLESMLPGGLGSLFG